MLDNINNIIDKEVKNINNSLNNYIKRRLKKETGVQVENKEDLFTLQKQYCILLYRLNADIFFNRSENKTGIQVVLMVDSPNPDKYGIHYMEVLGEVFEFKQNEDDRWVQVN